MNNEKRYEKILKVVSSKTWVLMFSFNTTISKNIRWHSGLHIALT